MKKIRHLPTVLGLVLLLLGVAAGVFLIRQGFSWVTQANPEILPKQVKTTNITNTSFSVSWVTDTATTGTIKYGPDDSLVFLAKDDRDKLSGQTGNFFTHHITVNEGIQPTTNYYFKIISGGATFDNNGRAYQLTTGPSLPPKQDSDTAHGTIADQNNSPVAGAIVYLSLANSAPQSTLTTSSGIWSMPLNVVRSSDLTNYVTYDKEASIEEIFVQGANLGTATAIALTKYDSPMPTITLGQTFDFKTTVPSPEISPPATTSPPARFDVTETDFPEGQQVKIINPGQDEDLSTLKPEFFGTGPAGETFTITVQSSQDFTDQVTINPDGTWSWIPPEDLTPGSHTITLTLADGGIISRLFTVLAAGTEDLPSFSATPSATLTPSPTTTPSATPTATASPTATPSGRISIPSTEAGITQPGYLTPTFLITIMGFVLIVWGIFAISPKKRLHD